jgi:hypothetical protein
MMRQKVKRQANVLKLQSTKLAFENAVKAEIIKVSLSPTNKDEDYIN